jgi:hypothetical protein
LRPCCDEIIHTVGVEDEKAAPLNGANAASQYGAAKLLAFGFTYHKLEEYIAAYVNAVQQFGYWY